MVNLKPIDARPSYKVPSPLVGEGQGEGTRAAARRELARECCTKLPKLTHCSCQRTDRRLPAPNPSPFPSPTRGEGTLETSADRFLSSLDPMNKEAGNCEIGAGAR